MQGNQGNKAAQASESLLVMTLITLSGGLQDAYSFMLRGGVFANAQTGNIVLLSESLFSGNAGRALSYLVPIAAFAAGSFAAAEIRHRFSASGRRIHWRQLVVAAEIALLLAVGFIPEGFPFAANALVSFACALQVETFRKVRGLSYASTMCIGNLRSCMESLSAYSHSRSGQDMSKTLCYAAVIAIFALGAGIGSLLSAHLGLRTIWISALLLAAAFSAMLRRSKEE